MKPAPPKQNAAQTIEPMLIALEHLLRAQLDGHKRLLQCVSRKRESIRTADIRALTTVCAEENKIIQMMAEIEKRRLDLIGALTQAIRPKAEKPLPVSEIAMVAADPLQTRLLALSAELRETLTELRRQSSIVRNAAETLSRHMTGIVQTVHSALSRARVYSHRGNITLGTSLQSMVDIKS